MEQKDIQTTTNAGNFLQVGEIILSSSYIEIDYLAGLMEWLLKNKSVKEYLKVLDQKKKTNSTQYLG